MPRPRLVRRLTTILSLCLAADAAAQTGRYDLLVSSRGTHSVKRYDGQTGEYLGEFVSGGTSGLSVTQDVRLGPDGNIYVTGRGTPAVLRFDRRTGAPLGPFTSGYTLDEPTKMTFLPDGRLYVSQWGQSKSSVAVFDGTTGQFLREATPNLNQPMQHLLDDAGTLLVANYGSRDVRRFGPDGTALGMATSGRELAGPVNLWRHDTGDLLVMDWLGNSVERFVAATGAWHSTFIDNIPNPEGFAIGPDGNLYIAHWNNHLIARYNRLTGELLGTFASGGGLMQPNSLLFVERLRDFALASPTATGSTVPFGTLVDVDITVRPDGGAPFDAPIQLGCTGLPAGWTCQLSAASVTPGSDAVTVRASVRAGVAVSSGTGTLTLVAALGAVALVAPTRRRHRNLAMLALTLVACGGGSTGPLDDGEDEDPPNPVTATIVVHGTADGLTRSASFTITAE